jgi:hypothetical protein
MTTKTITATAKGVAINYEDTGKSCFIPYEPNAYQEKEKQNYQKSVRFYEMNTIQRNMYRRLLYGLGAYSQEEIKTMSPAIIFSINKDHHKAKQQINKLKYERMFGAVNKLLNVIFPHVKFDFYKDGQDVNFPTFKELKISTIDIVNTWIEGKLLPSNFHQLSEEQLHL